MSSQDFWVNIDPDLECRDPTLLAVRRYWDEKRGQRVMPSRGDIDPMDIVGHLGNIVLIDVERAPFRLRYRLIGTEITEVMQRDSTGKYYDEIYPPELLEKIYASFHWIFANKAPLRTHGEAFYPDRNIYGYETLNLPLSNDGEVINMILGVLAFHLKPLSG
ncbi:MAG: PAS domain-containing protein [Alphaproteobacteria bacterium]|nr:PAS domain-containing protein [Alphaproteobacteria bacterium]